MGRESVESLEYKLRSANLAIKVAIFVSQQKSRAWMNSGNVIRVNAAVYVRSSW